MLACCNIYSNILMVWLSPGMMGILGLHYPLLIGMLSALPIMQCHLWYWYIDIINKNTLHGLFSTGIWYSLSTGKINYIKKLSYVKCRLVSFAVFSSSQIDFIVETVYWCLFVFWIIYLYSVLCVWYSVLLYDIVINRYIWSLAVMFILLVLLLFVEMVCTVLHVW